MHCRYFESLPSLPALPARDVMISHTVQCTLTDIQYLAGSPTVELIGPGDSVLATEMNLTVMHTLDPLMTS